MNSLKHQVKRISELLPKIVRNLRIARLIEGVKPGLTTSQLMVLLILKGTKKFPIPVGKLVQELAVSFPTVTGIVDRLYHENLVERISSESDRRLVLLKLTEEGTKVIDKLQKALEQILIKVLRKMNPAEQKAITEAAEKIFEFSLMLTTGENKDLKSLEKP
mgnify:CR=1 FL=1